MSRYFDAQLNCILEGVISENIFKKWPHIVNKIMARVKQLWPEYPNERSKRIGEIADDNFISSIEFAARAWHATERDPETFPTPDDYAGHDPYHGSPKAKYLRLKMRQNFNESLDGTDYIEPYLMQSPPENVADRGPRNVGVSRPVFSHPMKELIVFDPVAQRTRGKKTPYLNKIVDWAIEGTIDVHWDTNGVNEILTKYHNLKHNEGVELPSIDSFDHIGDLRELLTDFEDETARFQKQKPLSETNYGGRTYRLYQVASEYADAREALCDSGWCVRDEPTYNNYTRKGPLYIVSRQFGKQKERRYALMHPATRELKDVHNRSMTLEQAAPFRQLFMSAPNGQVMTWVRSEMEKMVDHGNARGDLGVLFPLFPEIVEDLATKDLKKLIRLTDDLENAGYEWSGNIMDMIYQDPEMVFIFVSELPYNKRTEEAENVMITAIERGGGERRAPEGVNRTNERWGFVDPALRYFGTRSHLFPDYRWLELEKVIPEVDEYSYDVRRVSTAAQQYMSDNISGQDFLRLISPKTLLSPVSRRYDLSDLLRRMTNVIDAVMQKLKDDGLTGRLRGSGGFEMFE